MNPKPQIYRSVRATLAVAALSLIWLVILPWMGQRPMFRDHIRMMERDGIDPSAMFYSELRELDEVEATFRRLAEEEPDLFWRKSGTGLEETSR
jgi:threonine dehydrogenase-like Zn-dependent dehydrogenase